MQHDPEGHETAALAALAPEIDGARVLEIGCGDGRLTRRYAGRARAIVAIDPDQAAIATFRRSVPPHLAPRIELRVERWSASAASGPFDVVIFSWSL
jgi:2-polyprenyl-3-methyl-5-hydroxy-6-metoxy-1,4-benzoquinol methylase